MRFRIDDAPAYLLGGVAEAVRTLRREGREIIDLSQMNPDLGAPAVAIESLVQASLYPHHHRYSASQGISRLRESFAAWYHTRYGGEELSPETDIVVTMGTKEGISHLLLAILEHGDTVMIPSPSYPIHTTAVFLAGGVVRPIPFGLELSVQANPALTADEEERFLATVRHEVQSTHPPPRVLVVSFPHNPTTVVVSMRFWTQLVELAHECGFFILHDFAYGSLVFDGTIAPSILQAPGAREVAVEFFSLSKGYSMPGFRVGFCAGNPTLVSALRKVKSYLDSGQFQPIQLAAVRVLEVPSVVDEYLRRYQSRRDVLADGLVRVGWNVERPLATPFVWAKIPPQFAEMESTRFSRLLLEEGGVAVCPGAGFGSGGEQFVRFALVEEESVLRRAVQHLEPLIRGGRA